MASIERVKPAVSLAQSVGGFPFQAWQSAMALCVGSLLEALPIVGVQTGWGSSATARKLYAPYPYPSAGASIFPV